MATSKSNEFEEYIKGLLECPVCMKAIKSAPIHQCTNGHVVCKDCIPKCENCPICRNDSTIARNLIFEQIIEKFSAVELANEEPSEKTKIQKWGKGFVGASYSNESLINIWAELDQVIRDSYANRAIQNANAANATIQEANATIPDADANQAIQEANATIQEANATIRDANANQYTQEANATIRDAIANANQAIQEANANIRGANANQATQEANATIQEANAANRDANANQAIRDANATIQEGNATVQEANATIQRTNAMNSDMIVENIVPSQIITSR